MIYGTKEAITDYTYKWKLGKMTCLVLILKSVNHFPLQTELNIRCYVVLNASRQRVWVGG